MEEKNPIEGTWKLVYGKYSSPDTTYLFPVTDYDRHIWMINRTHSMWISQDTSRENIYGFGGSTYTLDGEKYTGQIKMHVMSESVGKTFTSILKVKGDTLIQSAIWPAKEYGSGEYNEDLYEVFKRID